MLNHRVTTQRLLFIGFSLTIVSTIALSATGLFKAANSQTSPADKNQTAEQGRISIPLVANQLDPVVGVIPVELKCDATIPVLPNTLDGIPCTIKNNTNKVITALVLSTSVSIYSNGKLSTENGYVTIDTFVHPDFYDKLKSGGLNQYAEPRFPSAREMFDGTITQLRVHIDYVEFADKQTLGPNRKGADIVAGIREGAAKYKDWLLKEFQTNGRSADILVRLLEEGQPLPNDLEIKSGNEEQGAVIYRNQLRKIYRTEGLEQLMKRWNY